MKFNLASVLHKKTQIELCQSNKIPINNYFNEVNQLTCLLNI